METVPQDTGLQCLSLLLRFHQVAADPTQIAHQFAGKATGVGEMLRCAKQLKLKARAVSEIWSGLSRLSLPAIIQRRDDTFVIAGQDRHRRYSNPGSAAKGTAGST
jgi:subfamily B ATP-binding cassette protein HlyB/CyaB